VSRGHRTRRARGRWFVVSLLVRVAFERGEHIRIQLTEPCSAAGTN
jgi:hypothetical protein